VRRVEAALSGAAIGVRDLGASLDALRELLGLPCSRDE
jgi:hypothetical protein